MAGSSSRLDDSDMLEYLDTTDGDSDFILESDTDDTSEDAPRATQPAAHPVSDMDDEDYSKFYHLSNVSLFLSNSKNRLDLSICLLLMLTSISSSQT
jgi:hypothetical protein